MCQLSRLKWRKSGLAHPDILKTITKFGCGPASTNIVAFGAVQGALSDMVHAKRSRAYVQKARGYYEKECQKPGLKTVSGSPPCILIQLDDRAQTVYEALKKRLFP